MFAFRLRSSSKIQLAGVAVLVAALVVVLQARKPDRANASTLATVTCGQTIIASITVTNDLTNCPGNGLIVGHDSITITLTGRTIDGTGAAAGATGIYVGAHKSVIITGGTIQEFGQGVLISGITNTVKNGGYAYNGTGVYVTSGSGNTITLNTIYSNGTGAAIYGSADKITSNTISNTTSNYGLLVAASSSVITGNHALNNNAFGIYVDYSATATTVTSNVANGNGSDGIRGVRPLQTFTTNTANYNTQLGINAAPGSTDGNGNKGHDNGAAKQCVNVVCP